MSLSISGKAIISGKGIVSGPPSDPYIANVQSLLNANGTATVVPTTDDLGTPLTVIGTTQYNTLPAPLYGTTALAFGPGKFYTTNTSASYDFTSLGSFTVEAWTYFGTIAGSQQIFFESTVNAGASAKFAMSMNLGNITCNNALSGYMTTGGSPIAANTWTHIAFCRDFDGGTDRIFLDGVETVTNAGAKQSFGGGNSIQWGAHLVASLPIQAGGFMKNMRVTLGVARYISNFTPALTELPTA